jgi:hypothetical protein
MTISTKRIQWHHTGEMLNVAEIAREKPKNSGTVTVFIQVQQPSDTRMSRDWFRA